MKKFKTIAVTFVAAAMMLGGCNSGGGTGDAANGSADVDGAQLVTTAQEKMASWESYSFHMDMDMMMDMKEEGKMTMVMGADAKAVATPSLLMQMDTTMDMTIEAEGIPEGQGQQSVDMTQYIEGTDEAITLYQNIGGTWMKSSITDPDLIAATTKDPSETLGTYTEYMESATVEGEEKVGDVDCYKVNVVLSTDAMAELLDSFQGADSMGIDVETLTQSKDVLDKAGELSTILYIGKEDGEFYKQDMDISNLMKQAMLVGMADQGFTEDKLGDITMTSSTTYNKLDAAPEITIPEEAKNAPEMSF